MEITRIKEKKSLHTFKDSTKRQAFEKDKQAESLYPPFCQRANKMGENGKAERSEPVYK